MSLKSTVGLLVNVTRERFLCIFSHPSVSHRRLARWWCGKTRVSDILVLERSGVYSGGEQVVSSSLMKCGVQLLPVHEYKAVAGYIMAISWPSPRNAAALLVQNVLMCQDIFVSPNFYLFMFRVHSHLGV